MLFNSSCNLSITKTKIWKVISLFYSWRQSWIPSECSSWYEEPGRLWILGSQALFLTSCKQKEAISGSSLCGKSPWNSWYIHMPDVWYTHPVPLSLQVLPLARGQTLKSGSSCSSGKQLNSATQARRWRRRPAQFSSVSIRWAWARPSKAVWTWCWACRICTGLSVMRDQGPSPCFLLMQKLSTGSWATNVTCPRWVFSALTLWLL